METLSSSGARWVPWNKGKRIDQCSSKSRSRLVKVSLPGFRRGDWSLPTICFRVDRMPQRTCRRPNMRALSIVGPPPSGSMTPRTVRTPCDERKRR